MKKSAIMVALAAAFVASGAPEAAAQNVGADCRPALARYQAAAGPKAFAAGRTRGCGWQTQQSAQMNIAAIQARAIQQCQSAGGDECRIVASVATGSGGNLNAQGRTPQCEQAFGRYRAASAPKAFAQGATGSCGWQIANSQFRTPAEIQARAVAQCRSEGGQNCRVVATAP